MIRTLCTAALLALLAGAAPLSAQNAEKPSMNPDSGKTAGGKDDPTGFGAFAKDRPKGAQTIITAKKQATFDNAASIAEFEGSVVVTDPQFKLMCDKLKVFLNKERKGLEHVEAIGNVIIIQENKDDAGKPVIAQGRGGKAIYYTNTGIMTLTIWPQLKRGISSQVATEEGTVMTLSKDGQLTTTGASKTILQELN